MTDKEHADAIVKAAMALCDAVNAGIDAGLTVKIVEIPMATMGSAGAHMLYSPMVKRVTTTLLAGPGAEED